MLELLLDFVLKLLGKVVPWAVRWFYKPSRIAERIRIAPRGEGEALTFSAGDLPSVSVWLQVTNLSPFTIEIDRVLVQVQVGGVIGEFSALRRLEFKPSSDGLYKIESTLTDKQVAWLFRNRTISSYATLYVTAFFNCAIHDLEVNRSLQTPNIRTLGIPGAA